jgi:hypothetical protein
MATNLVSFPSGFPNNICSFFIFISLPWPNVVVNWLTLLLPIQKLQGSNLGPETSYPDWGFSWYSSVPSGEFRDSTLKLGHDHFLQNPFHFVIHLSPFYSTLYTYVVFVSEKASLNKLKINKYLSYAYQLRVPRIYLFHLHLTNLMNLENGDNMSIRNVGIYLQVHMASEPRLVDW